MNASLRLGWFSIFVLFMASATAATQPNLILNGTFADDSGWNSLGQYDGGQGTGKIEKNSYIIDISSAGSVPWSIQFTQNRIVLDSGSVYVFSYDITCSIERTVEVSLSRNGGDYTSYCGRDTVPVSSTLYHAEKKFVMKNPTDRDVRLEFNCGKATGKITLQNIKLVLFTEPTLTVGTPHSGEQLIGGTPYSITWSALNIGANVRIDLSTDNGAAWKTIGTAPADSGKFNWVVGTSFSPWCRIRIASVTDTLMAALNDGPFECIPGRELVTNSRFNLSSKEWNLGVYGGTASGGMHRDSAYRIHIEKSGDDYWQIQLSQNGIPLVKGQTYLLSFIASATASSSIKINIGMDHGEYTTYFDTTKWIVPVSTKRKRYTIAFTMNLPSDSSARVEFNCGKSSGDILIDEISVVPDYVAPVISAGSVARKPADSAYRTNLLVGTVGSATTLSGANGSGRPSRLLDLQGRTVGQAASRKEGTTTRASVQHRAPGLYIMENIRRRTK